MAWAQYRKILFMLLICASFSAWRDEKASKNDAIREQVRIQGDLDSTKKDLDSYKTENTALRIGVEERQRQINSFAIDPKTATRETKQTKTSPPDQKPAVATSEPQATTTSPIRPLTEGLRISVIVKKPEHGHAK